MPEVSSAAKGWAEAEDTVSRRPPSPAFGGKRAPCGRRGSHATATVVSARPPGRSGSIPAVMTGGDLIADVLKQQGVSWLFTLCGGHISPILVSAKARGIRVVDVRHEANAVFAADAVARLTGVPGVAAVTAGPGGANTVTAVKNPQPPPSPGVVLGVPTPTLLTSPTSLPHLSQIT